MKYAVILLLAIMAAGAVSAGENPSFCNGDDKCTWSSDIPNYNGLPLRSTENICSSDLLLNTYWPVGYDDATVTCTFSSNSTQIMDFYYSIDDEIVSCTLNGNPVSGFPFQNDECAVSDPINGNRTSISASSGQNTLVCVVRYTGGMSYFNGCVIGEEPVEPLPEFSSALIPLAILTIIPALAYLLASRRRQ